MISLAVAGSAGLISATSEAGPAPAAVSRDLSLQLRIRDALSDIPALAKINIGVRVNGGIVTLQGPLSSRELAEQTVSQVRKMNGVTEVRDELYVPTKDDAVAQAIPRPVTTNRPPTVIDRTVPPPKLNVTPVAGHRTLPTLLEQIDRLRSTDLRFAEIRIEIREGRVILRGHVARARDAWDFADIVGRLPGVAGVTITTRTR
jgi:osmotically-inducible protein OsmY